MDFITKFSFKCEQLVKKIKCFDKFDINEAVQMANVIGSLKWNDKNHKKMYNIFLFSAKRCSNEFQNCHVHTQTIAGCAFQVNITDTVFEFEKRENGEMYKITIQWNAWQNTPKKYFIIVDMYVSKQCRQVRKSIFSGFQTFCRLDMFVIFLYIVTCTPEPFLLRFNVRIVETM